MTTAAILATLASFGAGYAAYAAINCRALHAKLDRANAVADAAIDELWKQAAEFGESERQCAQLREELRQSADARAQAMLKRQVRDLYEQLADRNDQLAAARTAFSAQRVFYSQHETEKQPHPTAAECEE